jgi:Iodothyronine deiodinase
VSLRELYKSYSDSVQFLPIYIREAHPVDGWWMGGGIMGKMMKKYSPSTAFDVYDPKTMEERRTVAGRCETTLQYGIHTYIDKMDDSVSHAYAARPTRLYLIGLDGRILYAAEPGPYGFKPNELKHAIDIYLNMNP